MFMWIIVAALCFGAVFDGLGAVKSIERFFLSDLGLDAVDSDDPDAGERSSSSACSSTTPRCLSSLRRCFIPLAGSLGFDLVRYGVLYTITCQIAYITPPFGYNLFLMRAHGAAGDHAAGHLSVRRSVRRDHAADAR